MKQTNQEDVIGNRDTGGILTKWLIKQHPEQHITRKEYQISTHKYGQWARLAMAILAPLIMMDTMEGVAFVWQKVSINMSIDIRG